MLILEDFPIKKQIRQRYLVKFLLFTFKCSLLTEIDNMLQVSATMIVLF